MRGLEAAAAPHLQQGIWPQVLSTHLQLPVRQDTILKDPPRCVFRVLGGSRAVVVRLLHALQATTPCLEWVPAQPARRTTSATPRWALRESAQKAPTAQVVPTPAVSAQVVPTAQRPSPLAQRPAPLATPLWQGPLTAPLPPAPTTRTQASTSRQAPSLSARPPQTTLVSWVATPPTAPTSSAPPPGADATLILEDKTPQAALPHQDSSRTRALGPSPTDLWGSCCLVLQTGRTWRALSALPASTAPRSLPRLPAAQANSTRLCGDTLLPPASAAPQATCAAAPLTATTSSTLVPAATSALKAQPLLQPVSQAPTGINSEEYRREAATSVRTGTTALRPALIPRSVLAGTYVP